MSRGGWSPPLPKMTQQSSSLWRMRFGSLRRRQEALAAGSRPGCSRWQRSGAGCGVRSGCRQWAKDRRPGDRCDRWWERWGQWWWGREASGFGCRLATAQRTRYCSPADKANVKLLLNEMSRLILYIKEVPRKKISKYFFSAVYILCQIAGKKIR